jgi:hypothetical protein
MDSRNCGYCKNCGAGNYDACTSLQPSASAEPVQAEAVARRFHEAYERLAPSFGYTTRTETREWSPESTNGQLMIAVCEELFASPVTAAREQEASATGAEMKSIAYPGADLSCGDKKSINRVRNALHAEAETVPALRAELIEARKATPTTSTTGKVDASRVRDEALSEAVGLYESEEVLAPVGNSAWGEAYQEGWISGAQAYREAIRSLIGTPKSAEGEGVVAGAEPTMVAIAKRNLCAYLSKASFASNVDREAALNCVEVLEQALAAVKEN